MALLASLYVLWQVRSIVFLFFAAVLFAIAINRFVRRLQKSGANRGAAIALALSTCLAVLGLFLTCIIVPLSSQFAQLNELIPFGIGQIREWNDQLQAIVPGQVMKNVLNLDDFSIRLQQVVNWLMLHLYRLFSNSLALVLNTLLVVVLTLMLLVNPKQYRKLLIQASPAFYRQRINDILSICESKLVHYVLGIAVSMTFIEVTSTIGLLALDAPLPLVNGLLAGLSAFIPYIGAIASVIPPLLLSLLDSPWKAGEVLLLYVVIQQIEGNFITPIVMKQQVSLLPATTLALLTALGTVFGFLGLFLGLPIIVVAQTFIKEILVNDVLDRWKAPSLRQEDHTAIS
ncbi:MAG: AI-2E family transporter [Stenomitos frigidus ULC029]